MEDLSHLASQLVNPYDNNVLIDFKDNEDAGVYRLSPTLALVQTVDFITPVVDDPFVYGQIAAANALSDVYAMGGIVKCALNLMMWDKSRIPKDYAKAILEGGLSKIKEAGGVLIGGHTLADDTQKYGLSVSGVVHPEKIWCNNGAKVDDVFILTKPIGIGVLTTALKANLLDAQTQNKISQIMATLNRNACEVAKGFKINACTDITGFGLLGHFKEMLNPNINIVLNSNTIPLIEEAIPFAKEGIIPSGSLNNQKALEGLCSFALKETSTFKGVEILLFDAQTSGGLVFATPKQDAFKLLKSLRNAGVESAQIIGVAEPYSPHKSRISIV
ncbi:selenide, water dikinase SelD [Helicobacter sp.]|uniref:selenide, water dikinase SelD n=1 Tax=Helicobacter sp. TaxID=218 RepID=UPI0025C45A36|nr:selenide, water dikinase SelD [Helicobacter sp.]MCI5969078.1 selenide, water dikinase SelD [Helicobacter sp.]